MVAGVGQAAHPASTPASIRPGRDRGAEQDVVEAQAGVALPVLPEVVPEGVDALVGMAGAEGVQPALRQQALVAGRGSPAAAGRSSATTAGCRCRSRWGRRCSRRPAPPDGRCRSSAAGVGEQPLEPGQLVLELGTGLRVAVGQVQAADQHAVDRRLEVAALLVGRDRRAGRGGSRSAACPWPGWRRRSRSAAPCQSAP